MKLNLSGITHIVTVANYSLSVPDFFITTSKEKKVLKMIFISRISPKKNLVQLLSALNNIGNDIYCELTIRGSIEEEQYWQNCQDIIAQLLSNIKVSYDGPARHEEINMLLQNHHLFTLPTFGENFGHAIFEAFAA